MVRGSLLKTRTRTRCLTQSMILQSITQPSFAMSCSRRKRQPSGMQGTTWSSSKRSWRLFPQLATSFSRGNSGHRPAIACPCPMERDHGPLDAPPDRRRPARSWKGGHRQCYPQRGRRCRMVCKAQRLRLRRADHRNTTRAVHNILRLPLPPRDGASTGGGGAAHLRLSLAARGGHSKTTRRCIIMGSRPDGTSPRPGA